MKLKYALIGCGRIALNHIVAAQNANCCIVGLCDICPQHMEELAQRANLPSSVLFFTDYKELIEKCRPDVVSIATPSGFHASIATYCCENKIHTIVEKPVALSLKEAYAIQEVALKRNVKVTVCHQNRYNKAVKAAYQLVCEEKLGDVYSIIANVLWNRDKAYYQLSNWRGTWEMDGGVLMNQGIHNIDLLRWFAGGTINSVASFIDNIHHPEIYTEDIGVAIVKFDNNCIGTINCTSNVYPANLEETLYILGTKGTIKLGGKSVNNIDCLEVAGVGDAKRIIMENSIEPPNIYGYGHTPLFQDFISSIINDDSPYISIQEGIRSIELVLGIYKAARDNEKIAFPYGEFSTLEMKGCFAHEI